MTFRRLRNPEFDRSNFLKINTPDRNANAVTKIYAQTDRYQLYDDGGHVQYNLAGDYNFNRKLREKALYAISTERTKIEALRENRQIQKCDSEFCWPNACARHGASV